MRLHHVQDEGRAVEGVALVGEEVAGDGGAVHSLLAVLAGGEHTGSVMISDMIGQRNSSAQSSRSRSSATCNFSATARR